MWRKIDILDNYEASALSHPVDKKNSGQVRSRLQNIERQINMKLYGQTVQKGQAIDFWAAMRDPKKREALMNV